MLLVLIFWWMGGSRVFDVDMSEIYVHGGVAKSCDSAVVQRQDSIIFTSGQASVYWGSHQETGVIPSTACHWRADGTYDNHGSHNGVSLEISSFKGQHRSRVN